MGTTRKLDHSDSRSSESASEPIIASRLWLIPTTSDKKMKLGFFVCNDFGRSGRSSHSVLVVYLVGRLVNNSRFSATACSVALPRLQKVLILVTAPPKRKGQPRPRTNDIHTAYGKPCG